MPTTFRGLASLFLLSFLSLPTSAQLATPLIFRSGMVLQRQVEVPVWGQAEIGATVFMELNDLVDSTSAGPDGSWEIRLPALNEGGPHELIIRSGTDSLVYTEVYIGDVWLASGQSNMAWALKDCDNAPAEIAASNNQEIRQFLVERSLGPSPREELPDGSAWTPATSEFVGDFSGVGYYFAKYLHAHQDLPLGIINTSLPGARIESWMSKDMLGYDEQDIQFGEGQSYLQATLAYNHMLHPLLRFPIRGIIWYQGESNMGSRETALMYTGQLKKLISSWRELWGLGDIPFLWVQIPNTGAEASENSPGTWDALPMLRAAQSRVLSLPNTGEAITIDTGEPDIHPTNKEPVGERLALVARALAYGDSLVYSGPRYKAYRKLGDGKIELSFDYPGEGLVARETMDASLRWFALAGSNGTFYKASALLDSNKVVVWNPGISNPEYLRYAWESNPHKVNFYNSAGLPAAPFMLQVNHPGLEIQTFASTDYALDKGESALLTWQVYGSDQVLLNQMVVDSIGGIRVWPESDTVFTLRVMNREEPGSPAVDSAVVRIYVKEPDPLINLSSNAGEFVATGSEVIVHAEVSAPDGGSITQVEFLVNGKVMEVKSSAPYEARWSPHTPGTYLLSGIVTNHLGIKTISDTLRKQVDDFKILTLEAEDAHLTGRYRILEAEEVSAGFYVDLNRDWTLSVDSLSMEKDGLFQLSIGHMLNYGSPKIQDLFLNGDYFTSLVFDAPQEDRWNKLHVMVPLNQGTNTLSLKSNWGPMSIDYLSLLHKNTGNSSLDVERDPWEAENLRIHPNPVSGTSYITLFLQEAGPVVLELFDVSGQKQAELVRAYFSPGTHKFTFRTEKLKPGMYFLHLGHKSKNRILKMLIL
jgi:sialate O-acetylesterase